MKLLEEIAYEFGKGETNWNSEVLLELINNYYLSKSISPIRHLDDITKEKATISLAGVIGFNRGNPNHMKTNLAEYGLFSLKLADYSEEIQSMV